MHVHLPKPLHGWREFIGEVGIIVLGVLIALTAEGVAEDWSWHRKADAAQAAIRNELALDAGVFDERVMLAPCMEPKERQISVILKTAQQTHRLPNIEHISGPADRPLASAAWEAATADGTVSHLPDDFRARVSLLYQLIIDYRRMSADEYQLWSEIRLAEKSPGSISDALLAEISTALARARPETRSNDLAAEQSLEDLGALGVKPNYSTTVGDHGTRADLANADRCKLLTVDGKPLPSS